VIVGCSRRRCAAQDRWFFNKSIPDLSMWLSQGRG
jgi:hypothetical protein